MYFSIILNNCTVNTQSMKSYQIAALIGVIAISGFTGVTAMSGGILENPASDQSKTNEASSFSGHVIATVTAPDGTIKAYRQGDNIVVNQAKNCAPVLLFGATSPSGCNTAATPAAYNWIELTNRTATVTDYSITACPATVTATSGLTRAQGTATVTTQSSGATTSNSVTDITKTFTAGGAATVGGACLFDKSSSGELFAAKSFGSPVTLATNDQLTVDWQITMSSP